MIQSRRNALAILGATVAFLAPNRWTSAFTAQQPNPRPLPQPKPSANAPLNQNVPMGMDGPQLNPAQRQGDINRQLQAAIRTEVDKLCQMANELKEDMLRVNPGETLSVSFVKKAQAIEKLAKQIKDQAKG